MKRIGLLLAASLLPASVALAQEVAVAVKDAWVRATVPNQSATGAFMQLTAPRPARLVEVRSPVAAQVEIHEMKMESNVMRMRAVDALDLPAGRTVALSPGGYHVMLTGLKGPVRVGDTVPITLVVEDAASRTRRTVEVSAPVRPLGLAAGRGPAAAAGHSGSADHADRADH